MDTTTILGLVAGACTTVSFFPQLVKAAKSRSTKDVSLLMYAVFTLGIALWLVYGVLIDSLPVILANVVTLALTTVIIVLKIRYK